MDIGSIPHWPILAGFVPISFPLPGRPFRYALVINKIVTVLLETSNTTARVIWENRHLDTTHSRDFEL